MTWTADAQPWCCTNCGYWQRFPTRPTWCPVCLDHRHAVPRRGWDFRTPNDLAGRWRTVWRQIEPGLWRFTNDPQLGIGGAGYLVKRPEGNVAFEACAWYSEVALAWIAALGGVAWAAASHPHAYGGLWQLQERFGCEVSVQRHDLAWSGSFRCTWPFDDFLDLGGGLTLHHTGGHFDGYAVLHSVPRRLLFSGDALKLERSPDDPRSAEALSTHKSHVRAVPLTPVELRRYRDVFARLAFDQTWTPFEQGANAGRAAALALIDDQLGGTPHARFVPVVAS